MSDCDKHNEGGKERCGGQICQLHVVDNLGDPACVLQ